ncbi:malto-oligosyltrehalose synthase [Pseudonocardia sp. KRD-184]|uniref:Malto-oligosyltrehalose synthase n=1 Tax=Pseudonocardia oceani TaxID=2792013 RepID=A0ABS6UFR6_9PSEU|nr:malto-oligosyltrehalose synthase [Pseudonocardia oceani]MBW0091858.1 malto-oligosyltrehalose synthase [Pseudonocardia oceani]MBW0099001.1 malto-oligosyltrehalose synthase [Pseudonocardia oceani]MBW0111498.1 malto-oligosyltrehalose synthase [Pseudonocardia oceani]MBW0125222.1 malto-oligosyltrehalose synthase [Pseudonocardia oceani]MBW0131095.1 malto-oligosyltrehalose synthase [Pseudonocardia oceani]
MAPSSTYRLQFSKDTTFDDAVGLVPYLDALGVGALYASPLLESGAGSNHGYDVVDPTRVSAERGGEEGRRRLVDAVRAAGLGFVLDIVPNHVGVEVAKANPWWWDVLRLGRESEHADTFDIDWDAGPVLLPILGDDSVDDLTVVDGELRYYEHAFPIAPGTGEGTPQEVHERQHYRLVHWKRGAAELTYRRFFDVSTLAAVRVEVPEIFEKTHREVLRWVDAGDVDGIRVDHPDGLADPGAYMRMLRAAIGPERWLLVEKILGVGEDLPPSWPVDGTSGYEALREVQGVFVDPDGAGLLTQLAAEHTGGKQSLHAAEHDARREVAGTILAAEVRRIAATAARAWRTGPEPRFPLTSVEDAVAELLCGFPVYRSYLPEGRDTLDTAVSVARTHRPDLADVLDAIRATMLAEPGAELATRVQQTSGMVMAKGVEDTAFYRWNRFVALNEVGGDPARFGVSPGEFHTALAVREASWPATMTTLSTHDAKRSEDVRARLAVLAEIPGEWAEKFHRWSAAHPLPDRSLDLLAWQNLVGAWPISVERMAGYLGKASKEAKLVTSHVEAAAEVDEAVTAWPAAVMADAAIVAEIEQFVARISGPGRANSLGQKLLQIAAPGVPDVYQGTELFEYSLVDPDNRRPVDWAERRDLLARLDGGWLPDVDADGAAKLLVTISALRLRRRRPGLFDGYRAVPAQGPAAGHAVAFSRSSSLVAVATRLPVGLAARGGWGDTVLPLPDAATDWVDVVSGTAVDGSALALGTLLARYPVALLVRPE